MSDGRFAMSSFICTAENRWTTEKAVSAEHPDARRVQKYDNGTYKMKCPHCGISWKIVGVVLNEAPVPPEASKAEMLIEKIRTIVDEACRRHEDDHYFEAMREIADLLDGAL